MASHSRPFCTPSVRPPPDTIFPGGTGPRSWCGMSVSVNASGGYARHRP
jgi:hypothetical protein